MFLRVNLKFKSIISEIYFHIMVYNSNRIATIKNLTNAQVGGVGVQPTFIVIAPTNFGSITCINFLNDCYSFLE